MKILKFIVFIASITAFTNTFCVLFHVKNEGVEPITVETSFVRDILGITAGKHTEETLILPGQTVGINTGGGWESRDIYLHGKNIKSVTPKSIKLYEGKVQLHTSHDQNIIFRQIATAWFAEISPSLN